MNVTGTGIPAEMQKGSVRTFTRTNILHKLTAVEENVKVVQTWIVLQDKKGAQVIQCQER